MDDIEILGRLGLTLAIGLLLGLERGWHERGALEGARIAGIRTFALTGLLGEIGGWFVTVTGPAAGPAVLSAAFLALGALLAVSYRAQTRADRDLGLTTEVALLLTVALGAASVLGDPAPPPPPPPRTWWSRRCCWR